MIIEEVTYQLQIIKILPKVQKEYFCVEIRVIRDQLQKMNAKLIRLKKEFGSFKAKEEKLGQHIGKKMPVAKKKLVQPKRQGKSSENLIKSIKKRSTFYLKL